MARLRSLASTLVAISVFATASPAEPLFRARFRVYPTSLSPRDFEVTDLDRDGHPDLVVATNQQLDIWFGTEEGLFVRHQTRAFGGSLVAMALADLDADGPVDLLLVRNDPSTAGNILTTLRGQGDGTFGDASDLPTGPGPTDLIVGDFDGDGYLDAAVVCRGDESVRLYSGQGTLQMLSRSEHPSGPKPQALAAGDLNGDGTADLVVTNDDVATVSILPGIPGGTLGARISVYAPADLFHGYGNLRSPRLADLDGDSQLDLVIVNEGALVSVLRGLGDARFEWLASYGSSLLFEPQAATLADADADGRLDAIVVGPRGATLLHGEANGEFVPGLSFGLASGPTLPAAADFDADGQMDVAVASLSGVAVILRTSIGEFGVPTEIDAAANAQQIALGDFDSDDHLDLAVASAGPEWSTPGLVTILRADGTGSYSVRASLPTPASPNFLAAASLGPDAVPDLVVGSYPTLGGPAVAVFHGTGDGGLVEAQRFRMPALGFALADLDHDGSVDLVGAGEFLWLARGTAAGTFEPPTPVDSIAHGAAIVVRDFDGDAQLDVLVGLGTQYGVPISDLGVMMFAGRGDGTFAPPRLTRSDWHVSQLLPRDLGGDGILDLLLEEYRPGHPNTRVRTAVLHGRGDGTFDQESQLDLPFGRSRVLEDLDGDGLDDLVLPAYGNVVSVLRNALAAPGGTPEFYGTGVNPTAVASGDLNGDGERDVAVVNADGTVTILLNRSQSTPLEAFDLEAVRVPAGVLVRWRLSTAAVPDVQSAVVERAASATGPFTSLVTRPLVPAPQMSMLDPHPIPVVDAWYRVVLISAAAEMSIVGPVRYAPANIVSRTQLEPAWVSPADGLLHFAYTIATAGTPVRLELFDVRGRRLRSWSRIASEAGRYAETWDRRDGAGRRTARQVVVLRLSAGGVEAMRKIVVSR